ncbi:hypothetical protein CTM88_18055 [Photobacterium aquimaris]|uniref:Uncharacterized protein n=1 Tax=Photobacterium aquimaris TaxID=512643 RepID=A0A2T3IFP3_9GAMM|nr:hypothetical protein [Photobacterium aquimaris]OBU22025.1 hypothetical protein AYY20_12595 [Photobacterium aquimaris]PSU25115.1 hypothetical protein CTM88_18055 [Photobacterium aquimaris]
MKLHSKDNEIFVRLQNAGFIKQECISIIEREIYRLERCDRELLEKVEEDNKRRERVLKEIRNKKRDAFINCRSYGIN